MSGGARSEGQAKAAGTYVQAYADSKVNPTLEQPLLLEMVFGSETLSKVRLAKIRSDRRSLARSRASLAEEEHGRLK